MLKLLLTTAVVEIVDFGIDKINSKVVSLNAYET
jgi:hypothetical protein